MEESSGNRIQSNATTHFVIPNLTMILFESALTLGFVSGFILNIILVVVYIKRRGFRSQISNRFLLNLVLSNLFSCLTSIPLLAADQAVENDTLSTILRSSLAMSAVSSILSQVLIGLDQFLAVVDPLHYHRKVNKTKCHLLCVFSWFVSATFGLLGWFEGTDAIFVLVFFLSVMVVPFIFLVYVYSRVFVEAHVNSERTRRNSTCSGTFDQINNNYQHTPNYVKVNCLSPVATPQRPSRCSSVKSNSSSGASSFVGSVRHKLSNASAMFLYREESRAAKVSFLVLLTLLVCWTPYFMGMLIEAWGSALPFWQMSLMRACSVLSPVLTPFLYAFRSKRVQRDVKKAFGWAFGEDNKKKMQLTKRQRGNGLPKTITSPQIHSACHFLPAKLERAKSFSCPQLLISQFDDETNSKPSDRRLLGSTVRASRKFGIGSSSQWNPLFKLSQISGSCSSGLDSSGVFGPTSNTELIVSDDVVL